MAGLPLEKQGNERCGCMFVAKFFRQIFSSNPRALQLDSIQDYTWAAKLANAGVPPHTLMKMGGWSNIETVLKYYLKSSDENEKKAVRILDRLMEVVPTQELTVSSSQIPPKPNHQGTTRELLIAAKLPQKGKICLLTKL